MGKIGIRVGHSVHTHTKIHVISDEYTRVLSEYRRCEAVKHLIKIHTYHIQHMQTVQPAVVWPQCVQPLSV